jgi:inosine/xanthosine triphosphate pyrophosphatase family protein
VRDHGARQESRSKISVDDSEAVHALDSTRGESRRFGFDPFFASCGPIAPTARLDESQRNRNHDRARHVVVSLRE